MSNNRASPLDTIFLTVQYVYSYTYNFRGGGGHLPCPLPPPIPALVDKLQDSGYWELLI